MARARRSREDDEEREGEEEEGTRTIPESERPLDSGTVQALKQADPHTRARTLLQLQRLHGNATVQRVIRSLQVTDAGTSIPIPSPNRTRRVTMMTTSHSVLRRASQKKG